jgi:hypothetical protein
MTNKEVIEFVEHRVAMTKTYWDLYKQGPVTLKNYYEGQHSEAQRLLEFLKTGVPF